MSSRHDYLFLWRTKVDIGAGRQTWGKVALCLTSTMSKIGYVTLFPPKDVKYWIVWTAGGKHNVQGGLLKNIGPYGPYGPTGPYGPIRVFSFISWIYFIDFLDFLDFIDLFHRFHWFHWFPPPPRVGGVETETLWCTPWTSPIGQVRTCYYVL